MHTESEKERLLQNSLFFFAFGTHACVCVCVIPLRIFFLNIDTVLLLNCIGLYLYFILLLPNGYVIYSMSLWFSPVLSFSLFIPLFLRLRYACVIAVCFSYPLFFLNIDIELYCYWIALICTCILFCFIIDQWLYNLSLWFSRALSFSLSLSLSFIAFGMRACDSFMLFLLFIFS